MAEVEEEAPSKGGLIKIILMVVVVLLIAVGLFFLSNLNFSEFTF